MPVADSDHSLVDFDVNILSTAFTKGPGFWKCNVQVLSDNDFIEDLKYLCSNLMSDKSKDALWWEKCKNSFKRLIIMHSCRLSKNNKARIREIENKQTYNN